MNHRKLTLFHPSLCSGFFGADSIRPFNADMVERDLKAKKFKTKDLELAVRQALDPSLLDADEEDEDEEEEEEEEAEEPVKKTVTRGGKKGMAETIKKVVKTNGSKAGQKMDVDEDEEVTKVDKATTAKRRSRIIEDEDENEVSEGHNHDRPAKMVRSVPWLVPLVNWR